MDVKHNVVGWFEIPVADMERAIMFYETVFGFKINRQQMGPLDIGLFPGVENSIGSAGSLVRHADYHAPSAQGVLIYFTAWSGDVAVELSRVESAGGKILMPKTQISQDIGYMGLFLDSEGNRVALHAR